MRALWCVAGLLACGTADKASAPVEGEEEAPPLSEDALSGISAERMRDAVEFLADDAQGGRITGSPGHAAAMAWIVEDMADIGLEPVGLEGDYVYPNERHWNESDK